MSPALGVADSQKNLRRQLNPRNRMAEPRSRDRPLWPLSIPNLTGALWAGVALCSRRSYLLASTGFNPVAATGR